MGFLDVFKGVVSTLHSVSNTVGPIVDQVAPIVAALGTADDSGQITIGLVTFRNIDDLLVSMTKFKRIQTLCTNLNNQNSSDPGRYKAGEIATSAEERKAKDIDLKTIWTYGATAVLNEVLFLVSLLLRGNLPATLSPDFRGGPSRLILSSDEESLGDVTERFHVLMNVAEGYATDIAATMIQLNVISSYSNVSPTALTSTALGRTDFYMFKSLQISRVPKSIVEGWGNVLQGIMNGLYAEEINRIPIEKQI